jgi:AcrR family transcriptional regulator
MSRDQKKAESRRRILNAARDVFFRDGFMRANLDEMAEKAGVAKGALYRYFESKADLYVAVLTNNYEIFHEQMSAAGQNGDTGLARIRSIAKFYFDHWLNNPDYFQIFWALDNESVIGDLPRDVIEKIADFWEMNLNITHEALVYGVKRGEFVECDTWEIAHILWTITNGLIESDNTKARRLIRRRPLEPLYHHAIDTLIRGILVDPSEVALAPPTEPRKSTLIPLP